MALTVTQINQLYVSYFGRPADFQGVQFYTTANATADQVAAAFASSQESISLFGTTANIPAQINAIYQNLFNRDAEPAGLTYWTQQVQQGKITAAAAALAIGNSAAGADATVVANKVLVANAFVAAIDTTAEILGYSGDNAAATARAFIKTVTGTNLAASQAQVDAQLSAAVAVGGTIGSTLTLTTGVDTIVGTGGNDTINAVVSATAGETTLSLADTIDGAGGIDSLNVTIAGAVALPAATIKNVEKIFIKNLTGATTSDFASVTGATEVWTSGSTINSTFTGLSKVTLGVANTTKNLTATFNDTAFATAGSIDFAFNNAGDKNTSATVNVGTATTAGVANAATIAATGANFVTLAGTATYVAGNNGIKSLTVTGGGTLNLAAGSALVATTLANDLTTFNASANTGGVTATLSNAKVVITGGAGADVITIGGNLVKGATINLGAGNDQLLVNGGSISADVTVDGGDGIDVISNGLITVANGGVFKNFEKLALDTASTTDIELLTGSTISSYLINANVSATAQNVKSGSTVDVTSTTAAGTTTLAVKNAASSTTDALTFNFIGVDAAATTTTKAGTVVANEVEALTIASTGGANTNNSIAITDNKLKTITVTGNKDLALTFAAASGTNVAAGGGGVSSIDASALTGKLSVDLTNVVADNSSVGLTVKGGTANDTFTTSTFSATLTGGGGNDKFTVSASVAGTSDATTAVITTITDANAGDQLAFTALGTLTKTNTDIAAATNLTQALDLALKNAAVTAGNGAWFNYSGNTYVVVEDATNGFGGATTSDVVVKLAGVLDLTNATIATNVLTLAA